MAAAGKWKMYEEAKLALSNGEIDFANDAFEIALYLSTSDANTLTGTKTLASLTNQVATNFGYTQADGSAGGKVLTVTSGNTTGTIKIDGDNPVWTASGGSITARFAVIIDGTHASNIAVAVCKLDSADADVTATTGNTFTITMNASGMLTISGADSD
jgi:hypothetical protein